MSRRVLEPPVISVPVLMGGVLPYTFSEVKVCLLVLSPQKL